MGKHGAEELNYASDVDIVLVAPDDAEIDPSLARSVVAIASRAYRIDTNLRPEGRSGVLVRSVDSYVAYWERWARPWEFQALLKARYSAGDAATGQLFRRGGGRAPVVAALRRRRPRRAADDEGAGGGDRRQPGPRPARAQAGPRRDPRRRVLRAAAAARPRRPRPGPAAAGHAAGPRRAGRRRLRRGRGRGGAGHRLPVPAHRRAPPPARRGGAGPHRAVRPGVEGPPGAGARLPRAGPTETPGERFDAVLARHQGTGRAIHERLFFRPLLEAFAGGTADETLPGELAERPASTASPPDAAEERLAAFGFADADRTRQALSELTRGLTRSSRLMQQLLPLLLDWLSESPDPDQGLLGLRTLAGSPHRRDLLVTAFRESPELARRLCLLLGTSRRLGEIIARHPDFVELLDDKAALAAASMPGELVEKAMIAADQGPDRRAGALRHFFEIETVRIAARDVLGLAGLRETGRALADLGAAVVDGGLHAVAPGVPMAVIAMGSFGGAEIAYGSDLDVLARLRGLRCRRTRKRPSRRRRRFPAVQRGDAGRRDRPDRRLAAPRGQAGPAGPQPRRLRGVPPALGRDLGAPGAAARPARRRRRAASPSASSALADEAVWSVAPRRGRRAGDPQDEGAHRARADPAERRSAVPPEARPRLAQRRGVDGAAPPAPHRHPGDARHGRRSTASSVRARSSAADAAPLREAYRFCARTRNRWHLVGNYVAGAGGVVGSGADALPRQPELQSRLARSLGTTPTDLRESYRRVTRRSRKVVERVFYGL